MLDFRQLLGKGVSRVPKALKLIMENRNLGFAGLWFHSSPHQCVACGYYHIADLYMLHTM